MVKLRTKSQKIKLLLTAFISIIGLEFIPTPAYGDLAVSNPCTKQEHWSILDLANSSREEKAFGISWLKEINSLFSGHASPLRSFSNALALKRVSSNPNESIFSEYWISRSLQEAGLFHMAHYGLGLIVNQGVSPSTLSVQLAALACLVSMQQQHSGSLTLEGLSQSQLLKLNQALDSDTIASPQMEPIKTAIKTSMKTAIWQAAVFKVMDQNGSNKSDFIRILKSSGAPGVSGLPGLPNVYEKFATVLLSSMQGESESIVQGLSVLLPLIQTEVFFKPFLEHLKMISARAAYTSGKWSQSVDQYKLVHPRSNEWVAALSELSWAYLKGEKYREAIGAGIGLQSGSLRHTFAPESMMVMAIALNEMCRFPESMNVIQSFRKNYLETYQWLKNAGQKSSDPKELYKTAASFAKREPVLTVPVRVASEWIRSPLFISKQERINVTFKEKTQLKLLSQQMKDEKRAQMTKIVRTAQKLYLKLKQAKADSKSEKFITVALFEEIQTLKSEVVQYQRLKGAIPPLRKILAQADLNNSQLRKKLVVEIGTEIVRLNSHMLQLLGEIEENIELLEVEIWNGASEDIVWQNAHPNYKLMAQKMKDAKGQSSAGKVWNWGKIDGGFDGKGEIWEDEVGSLSADLYDNCESKDKYLGLGQKPAI